jgi:hypothetical protein
MSMAFEVSEDDLSTVLDKHNVRYTDESLAKMFDEHIMDEDSRIEKAALYGNDMDEQANYAQEEIEKILKEKGVI